MKNPNTPSLNTPEPVHPYEEVLAYEYLRAAAAAYAAGAHVGLLGGSDDPTPTLDLLAQCREDNAALDLWLQRNEGRHHGAA